MRDAGLRVQDAGDGRSLHSASDILHPGCVFQQLLALLMSSALTLHSPVPRDLLVQADLPEVQLPPERGQDHGCHVVRPIEAEPLEEPRERATGGEPPAVLHPAAQGWHQSDRDVLFLDTQSCDGFVAQASLPASRAPRPGSEGPAAVEVPRGRRHRAAVWVRAPVHVRRRQWPRAARAWRSPIATSNLAYSFTSTHVVMARSCCTLVVLSGSTRRPPSCSRPSEEYRFVDDEPFAAVGQPARDRPGTSSWCSSPMLDREPREQQAAAAPARATSRSPSRGSVRRRGRSAGRRSQITASIGLGQGSVSTWPSRSARPPVAAPGVRAASHCGDRGGSLSIANTSNPRPSR